MRRLAISVHRWISIAAVVFWLLQAATGVFSVFHWEIDDAIVGGAHQPTDFRAIERSVAGQRGARVSSPAEVSSIWTSAGARDRYDVHSDRGTLRIDGAGNVLRVTDGGGWVVTIVSLHHDLLAGERGRTFVGFSGLLLLSNIILGLVAAWPKRGQWRRALRPINAGARVAVLYSWHRALGLVLALPLLALIAAGVMLAFEETTESVLRAATESPSETRSGAHTVGMADAVSIALARFPGSEISGIGFPSGDNAMWRITLKQRGEMRRAYGRSRVFISAIDGRVLGEFDALQSRPGRRFFDYLFAFHAGEMFGIGGRIFSVVAGLALIALMIFGVSLWFARR
jgi:uncharacterized iron-regulated membrane protein